MLGRSMVRFQKDEMQLANLSTDGNPSSWINLGLWSGGESFDGRGFASASSALALAVVSQLSLAQRALVIDCGCGHGDLLGSLAEARPDLVLIGVNIDAMECSAARARATQAHIVHADAVAYCQAASQAQKLRGAFVVSVDSAYHFNTRLAFMKAVGAGGAAGLSMSDICLSEAWYRSGSQNSLGVLTRAWRSLCLMVISRVAGVPQVNLVVGPSALRLQLVNECGFASAKVRVITDQVLEPFAAHCLARCGGMHFSKKWAVLWSSAWFMRLLAWSGAVDVVLVAAPCAD